MHSHLYRFALQHLVSQQQVSIHSLYLSLLPPYTSMVNDADLLFPREVIPSYLQDRLGSDLEVCSHVLGPLSPVDTPRFGHWRPQTTVAAMWSCCRCSPSPPSSPSKSILVCGLIVHALTLEERFSYMKSCLNTYFTVVIVNKATDKASQLSYHPSAQG